MKKATTITISGKVTIPEHDVVESLVTAGITKTKSQYVGQAVREKLERDVPDRLHRAQTEFEIENTRIVPNELKVSFLDGKHLTHYVKTNIVPPVHYAFTMNYKLKRIPSIAAQTVFEYGLKYIVTVNRPHDELLLGSTVSISHIVDLQPVLVATIQKITVSANVPSIFAADTRNEGLVHEFKVTTR